MNKIIALVVKTHSWPPPGDRSPRGDPRCVTHSTVIRLVDQAHQRLYTLHQNYVQINDHESDIDWTRKPMVVALSAQSLGRRIYTS